MKPNMIFSLYIDNIKNECVRHKNLIEEKENIQFKKESKNKINLDLNNDSKEIKEEEIYDINFLDLNIEELDKLDI